MTISFLFCSLAHYRGAIAYCHKAELPFVNSQISNRSNELLID